METDTCVPNSDVDVPRRSAVRQFLAQEDLSGWIGWRPDELILLLGHFPHWGVSVCLFPREGQPVLIVPELEPRDHYPIDTEIITYGWGRMECSNPQRALCEALQRVIKSRGLTGSHLGYAEGYRQNSPSGCFAEFPPIHWNAKDLMESIAPGNARECGAAFQKLYEIKTAKEISAIRLANQVAVRALAVFQAAVVPSQTEAQIASVVESSILCETGTAGIHLSRGFAFVQSGSETAASGRYNRITGRSLEPGEAVLIELITCVNGYWSDLTRSLFAGAAPNQRQSKMLETVRHAQQKAIEAVRPGIPVGQLDHIAREIISEAGLGEFFTHGTGHHTGLRYHDPGAGLAPGGTACLEPGMIITVEPGIYSPEDGAGFRLEDNVLVTADGHEILSRREA